MAVWAAATDDRVLIAVIPCSLVVFIPYSIYPSMLRIVVNCLIFGGVCAWSLFRMKQGTLPDKSMLESLAAASLIFLMNGQRRDRSYLLFISIFLIIYGALIPRMLYLWLLFPYFILLLVLLYVNRPESLAGRQVTGKRAGSLRRSWPYYLLSLLLGLMVFWYLFGIMPLTNNDIPGMFEVSFLTEKDSALPPALQEWMHNDKVKQSAAGQKIIRNGQTGHGRIQRYADPPPESERGNESGGRRRRFLAGQRPAVLCKKPAETLSSGTALRCLRRRTMDDIHAPEACKAQQRQ